jgi:hypothetical protein
VYQALAVGVFERLGQPLRQLGEVNRRREIPRCPFLESGKAQEGTERYESALPGGEAVRPRPCRGLGLRTADAPLVRADEVAVDSRRSLCPRSFGEGQKALQVAAVLDDGALAAVPVELQPMEVLVDGLGERDRLTPARRSAGHPGILPPNCP